ncbi:PREDICTED: probable serine/threonine-, partial [Prunus dulcis]
MSLKGLELLTKHAEPVESAPETIPEASPPVVQEKQPAEEEDMNGKEKLGALSLCTKLSELHTKAPEHSFAYTKKTIERAFGRKLPEIFDNFEKKPVASGSIAQGHGAGQQVKPIVVAVKQVEEAFAFWGTPEGDLVHPAECMQQLLEKVRRHRVNVDGNVCTVMVTTLVLE